MDISTLIPTDRVIEIKHPQTEQPLGIRVTIVSLNDEKMKPIRKRIVNKRLELEKRGKNFKADEIEENELEILVGSVTSWEWYDSTFHGEIPVFNEKNVRQVFAELPWFKEQVAEAVGDEKAFFQG